VEDREVEKLLKGWGGPTGMIVCEVLDVQTGLKNIRIG
jgi:hypothetical protein